VKSGEGKRGVSEKRRQRKEEKKNQLIKGQEAQGRAVWLYQEGRETRRKEITEKETINRVSSWQPQKEIKPRARTG